MNVCWWEYDELVDHFQQRKDLYMPSEDNPGLWVRFVGGAEGSETAACAMMFAPPKTDGPYRQYSVRIVPAEWDQKECDKFLIELLTHWTSYGYRIRTQDFLTTQLSVVSKQAEMAAIALGRLDTDESYDPDKEKISYQPRLPIDADTFSNIGETTPSKITYLLERGGWLQLEPKDTAFRVTISVPNHKNWGGGYSGCPMSGYVRPVSGHVKQYAAFLAGVELQDYPRDLSHEPHQLELLKEE